MSSATEAAYLAGFIDGEGNISIEGSNNNWRFRVRVFNTNLHVLERLRDVWGGTINPLKIRFLGRKQCFVLCWSPYLAMKVLAEIQPYLIVKKEQCAIALQFQSTMHQSGWGFGKVSEEEREKRLHLRTQLLGLNQRGI